MRSATSDDYQKVSDKINICTRANLWQDAARPLIHRLNECLLINVFCGGKLKNHWPAEMVT